MYTCGLRAMTANFPSVYVHNNMFFRPSATPRRHALSLTVKTDCCNLLKILFLKIIISLFDNL